MAMAIPEAYSRFLGHKFVSYQVVVLIAPSVLLHCYYNPGLGAYSQMARYPQIGIRVKFLEQLDAWRRKQDDCPSRPEAIRRLVEIGLTSKK